MSTETSLEIVSSRVFQATRDQIWDTFSNPKRLARWWGPKGFTNQFSEFDFRAGGMWRFVMIGPDGATYDNAKEFVEVVKPEKIAFIHQGPMHRFTMSITLRDCGGRTEMTWRMVFEDREANLKLKDFIEQANEENFDRLEEELKRCAPPVGFDSSSQ